MDGVQTHQYDYSPRGTRLVKTRSPQHVTADICALPNKTSRDKHKVQILVKKTRTELNETLRYRFVHEM